MKDCRMLGAKWKVLVQLEMGTARANCRAGRRHLFILPKICKEHSYPPFSPN